MAKHRGLSGGGIESRRVVYKPLVIGQRRLDDIRAGRTDYIGQTVAFDKGPLAQARPKDRTDLGNYLAEKCPRGPGGGRTIYRSGFQALHGTPVQAEKDERDLKVMGKVANK